MEHMIVDPGTPPDEAADPHGTKAVVLAGGRGTRLAPYTSVLPKPLMPIGERTVLEIVVAQLAEHGFRDITFCVGYLSHLIEAVFNSGAGRGVQISYLKEAEPLGTAGPLRALHGIDEPFLAMNGDVLTALDYGELVNYHRRADNVFTIATYQRTIKIDYGVLYLRPDQDRMLRVEAYEEKPELSSTVSMGVYVLDPRALEYIPPAGHFDIPDLVHTLLRAGEQVGAYPYEGFWLDIGHHEDYQSAITAWESNGYFFREASKTQDH